MKWIEKQWSSMEDWNDDDNKKNNETSKPLKIDPRTSYRANRLEYLKQTTTKINKANKWTWSRRKYQPRIRSLSSTLTFSLNDNNRSETKEKNSSNSVRMYVCFIWIIMKRKTNEEDEEIIDKQEKRKFSFCFVFGKDRMKQ